MSKRAGSVLAVLAVALATACGAAPRARTAAVPDVAPAPVPATASDGPAAPASPSDAACDEPRLPTFTGLAASAPSSAPGIATASGAGGAIATGVPIVGIAAILDGAGRPVIAFRDAERARVRVWDGASWRAVESMTGGASELPAVGDLGMPSSLVLGVDDRDRLVLAYLEVARTGVASSAPRLRVFRSAAPSSGSLGALAWDDVSPARSPALTCTTWSVEFGGGARPPALLIDARGRVWAACAHFDVVRAPAMMPGTPVTRPRVDVWRWDGARFASRTLRDVPPSLQGDAEQLALDADGRVWISTIAWRAVAQRAMVPLDESLRLGTPRAIDAPRDAVPPRGSVRAWLDDTAIVLSPRHDDPPTSIPQPPPLARPSAHPTMQELAMARDDRALLLAWTTSSAFLQRGAAWSSLHALAYSEGAWHDLGDTRERGGLGADDARNDRPSITLDACRRPIVAYRAFRPDGVRAEVQAYDGARWIALPSIDVGEDGIPAIAHDGEGRLVLRWSASTPGQHTSGVFRLEDGAWRAIAEAAVPDRAYGLHSYTHCPTPGAVTCFAVAAFHRTIARESGAIATLTWADAEQRGTVAWDGTIVQLPLPAPVAALAGADATVDARGRVLVAVVDDDGEIRASRFTGTTFEPIADSGGAGGVSRTRALSLDPAIAHAGGRTCVAWSEHDGTATRVFVRCADG